MWCWWQWAGSRSEGGEAHRQKGDKDAGALEKAMQGTMESFKKSRVVESLMLTVLRDIPTGAQGRQARHQHLRW